MLLPRRPYLIRALYEWLVDSGEVPHLLVDATRPGCELPEGYVQDGRIVLNVGPTAVQALELGNELIRFSARFGGAPREVQFPPEAVIAVYGRESGQGMMFGPEDDGGGDGPDTGGKPQSRKPQGAARRPGKPSLKIIK